MNLDLCDDGYFFELLSGGRIFVIGSLNLPRFEFWWDNDLGFVDAPGFSEVLALLIREACEFLVEFEVETDNL